MQHYEPKSDSITDDRFMSRLDCACLLKEIKALPDQADGPNSMNKYGKVLTGLPQLVAKQLVQIIEPASIALYNKTLKKDPYAFIVEYHDGTQKSLAKHFDSSDVTLNLCLGGDFTGGDLVFYKNDKPIYTVKHKIGQAILHRGETIHRAKPIKSGWRTNLILWCKAI